MFNVGQASLPAGSGGILPPWSLDISPRLAERDNDGSRGLEATDWAGALFWSAPAERSVDGALDIRRAAVLRQAPDVARAPNPKRRGASLPAALQKWPRPAPGAGTFPHLVGGLRYIDTKSRATIMATLREAAGGILPPVEHSGQGCPENRQPRWLPYKGTSSTSSEFGLSSWPIRVIVVAPLEDKN